MLDDCKMKKKAFINSEALMLQMAQQAAETVTDKMDKRVQEMQSKQLYLKRKQDDA